MVAFPRSRSIFGAEAEALASDAPIQIVSLVTGGLFYGWVRPNVLE